MGRTPGGETREKVYRFVRERLLAGSPPTVREVQEAFGFRAVETAREHLDRLVIEGRLTRAGELQARGYRLPGVEGRGLAVSVPILGRVQAGALTVAIQDIEGYVEVRSRLPPEELFALRVRGDSMAPEMLEDDLVIVRRQPVALDGEIVVALIGDEATIKRLRFRRGGSELHAINPKYPPLVPDPEALLLLGRVVELRRYLGERR